MGTYEDAPPLHGGDVVAVFSPCSEHPHGVHYTGEGVGGLHGPELAVFDVRRVAGPHNPALVLGREYCSAINAEEICMQCETELMREDIGKVIEECRLMSIIPSADNADRLVMAKTRQARNRWVAMGES